jgi:hypothetical protein
VATGRPTSGEVTFFLLNRPREWSACLLCSGQEIACSVNVRDGLSTTRLQPVGPYCPSGVRGSYFLPLQYIISSLGQIENMFSISALTPSIKPFGPISTFPPVGMLHLGWISALTPSVKRAWVCEIFQNHINKGRVFFLGNHNGRSYLTNRWHP